MDFLTELNSLIWGKLMIVLLLFSGIYLTFKTGFIQFCRFGYMLKNTIFKKREKQKDGVTPFQAMSTALAGTIGTGSIAGIAKPKNILKNTAYTNPKKLEKFIPLTNKRVLYYDEFITENV